MNWDNLMSGAVGALVVLGAQELLTYLRARRQASEETADQEWIDQLADLDPDQVLSLEGLDRDDRARLFRLAKEGLVSYDPALKVFGLREPSGA